MDQKEINVTIKALLLQEYSAFSHSNVMIYKNLKGIFSNWLADLFSLELLRF